METLAKLKPVQGGVCTAANSSGENDGAAACVLMSEEKAKSLNLKPLSSVKAFAYSGADPRMAWKSVTVAVNIALKKTGLTLKQIDLIEIHEAFSAQVLANFKELGITEKDQERVNVNGSCISLGHPLGATGARILTTLVHEMQRRDAKLDSSPYAAGVEWAYVRFSRGHNILEATWKETAWSYLYLEGSRPCRNRTCDPLIKSILDNFSGSRSWNQPETVFNY